MLLKCIAVIDYVDFILNVSGVTIMRMLIGPVDVYLWITHRVRYMARYAFTMCNNNNNSNNNNVVEDWTVWIYILCFKHAYGAFDPLTMSTKQIT